MTTALCQERKPYSQLCSENSALACPTYIMSAWPETLKGMWLYTIVFFRDSSTMDTQQKMAKTSF